MAATSFFKRQLKLAIDELSVPLTKEKVTAAWKACGKRISKSRIMYQWINRELLSENQASCTNTLGTTEGFVQYNGSVISSSDENPFQGDKSLKCETNGDALNEGVYTSIANIEAELNHEVLCLINAPDGALLYITVNGVPGTPIVGTGEWEEITKSYVSVGNQENLYIATRGSVQNITFYIGKLSLKEKR